MSCYTLVSQLYSIGQFFSLMSFEAPGGRGPRFIEPPEPPGQLCLTLQSPEAVIVPHQII